MIESFEKIIDPNFINAELIGAPGAYKVVTIKDIDYLEAFNQKTNGKEKKQSLIFTDTKPLILNKTNSKTLKRLFSPNEDRPENCIGKTVELYVIETKVGSKKTTGIRIREHAEEICERCGRPIKGTASKTVREIIEISVRNLGKAYCIDCMRAAAEEQKEAHG